MLAGLWWVSLLLLVFAGICNAVMDVLKTRYNTSIFTSWPNQNWLKPSLSWRNKWKNGDPSQGPKFFGSTTFLVWITDFWHLAKFLMLMAISLAIVFRFPMLALVEINIWWLDFIIYYLIFTITFEIFYSKVLIKS